MPAYQTMVERANRKFSRRNIGKRDVAHAAGGTSISALFSNYGIAQTRDERRHLETWPTTMQEVVRVTIQNALSCDPPMPIGFSWSPGYDYSVKVWEAHAAAGSLAAITIHFESPYPQ